METRIITMADTTEPKKAPAKKAP
ncbi:MAG: hypothetical protein RIT17_542, partial [Pseudomonadota bacterium]